MDKKSKYSKVFSSQTSAVKAKLIELELNISQGQPQINIVGLPDKAVEEAKDRVSSALENSNFEKSTEFKTLKALFGKITISLAPADLKKNGALFDLPLAIAYLLAQEEIKEPKIDLEKTLFLGELALDGRIKPVKGALSAAKLASELGFKTLILPKANAKEAAFVDAVDVYGFEHLADLVEFLRAKRSVQKEPPLSLPQNFVKPKVLLDDIKGQALAKRALTIAAAGGHNMALFGPPGTGKSMLAKVFAELLPPLSKQEALEVTMIHSAAGVLRETVLFRPPFRAPHHSASYVSVIGGGANISPGEVTLAHKGVLFMDEFPEFDRRVINALREPLEERKITVARASGSETFPADFLLIVALNPCPCGFYGTSKCSCSISAVQRYQAKISGPIADRIDIWVNVDQVEYKKLLSDEKRSAKEHNLALKQIKKARALQNRRFTNNNYKLNAKMSAAAINKYIKLGSRETEILNTAAEKMGLSARAYHKVLKLARTIADLDEAEKIEEAHILETLSYRERQL